ncbi:hypothetical protein HNY73_001252 [Argiope bruennichi]|uniref:Integrase zinc-binding domain-containing protein n=1 Tax=Argiope bruennichi TaxID=94029 RepID=A0A8T0G0R3_ARGBR|nr:hypothetical protein HNY73_001252 [Argiope bruennichi]
MITILAGVTYFTPMDLTSRFQQMMMRLDHSHLIGQEDFEGLTLLNIDFIAFIAAQQSCKELQSLTKKILEKIESEKEFKILPNGLLVKKKFNKIGDDVLLLVVPKEFRERLKNLCHEGISCHLGVTKTKNNLIKFFFWANCYKEIEEFVRCCDHYQRVGKSNDKKRALLDEKEKEIAEKKSKIQELKACLTATEELLNQVQIKLAYTKSQHQFIKDEYAALQITYAIHEGEVDAVAWTLSDFKFATAGGDRKVKVSDFISGQAIFKGVAHESNSSVDFDAAETVLSFLAAIIEYLRLTCDEELTFERFLLALM